MEERAFRCPKITTTRKTLIKQDRRYEVGLMLCLLILANLAGLKTLGGTWRGFVIRVQRLPPALGWIEAR